MVNKTVPYILPLLLVELLDAFHGGSDQQVLELLVLHAQRDGVRMKAAVKAGRVRSVFVLLHVRRAQRVGHRPTSSLRCGGLGGHVNFIRLYDIKEDFLLVVVVFLNNLERLCNECRFGSVIKV